MTFQGAAVSKPLWASCRLREATACQGRSPLLDSSLSRRRMFSSPSLMPKRWRPYNHASASLYVIETGTVQWLEVKAMRGLIALQKHFVQNYRENVFCFAQLALPRKPSGDHVHAATAK